MTWLTEWRQAWRSLADFINPMAFFMIVASVWPMVIDIAPNQLKQLGPGVLWLALLLAVIIDLPHLFERDHQDGSIEQWILSGQSLAMLVIKRLSIHALFLLGPMLIICPLLAQLYGLSWSVLVRLWLSMLLAAPSLLLLGALVSSLLLSARQAGVLLAVLLLPLVMPILIFALGYATATVGGSSALWWLMAILLLSISVVPVLVSFALKECVQ